jgi:predicted metal-dependent RNase
VILNLSSQSLIDKAKLPKTNVDILLLETTYGSTDTGLILSLEKEAKRFATEANNIIGNGGSILIPVFSLGKHQEMLSTIWKMMQKGHTDSN